MNTKHTIIYMALGLLGLSACSNEEDPISNSWESDPQAVHIEASVGNSLFSRSNPLGDATAQAAFKEGDKVVVAAGSQQGTYTLTGGTWTPESGRYLKWESESMTFNAYTALTGATADEFSLPADQSTPEKVASADYMTCTVSATKPDAVSLVMKRQTAKIVISIANPNGVKAIESLSIYGNSVITNTKGTDGATTTSTGSTPAPFDPYKVTPDPAALTGTTYTALVAPNATPISEYPFVIIKFDGHRTQTYKGIPAVEAGKTYTYNLTVGGSINLLPVVDETTHTIASNGAGRITADLITTALNGGTELIVTGPINGDDIANITAQMKAAGGISSLNLSGATIVAGGTPATTANEISANMFQGCTSLTTLTIPASVTSIGANAFDGCSALTALTIPSGVTSIGDSFIAGCTALTSLTIESNKATLATVNPTAFTGFTNAANCDLKLDETRKEDFDKENETQEKKTVFAELSWKSVQKLDGSSFTAEPETGGSIDDVPMHGG